MPVATWLRSVEPWRGRNPFSSTFRLIFNEVAEIAYRMQQYESDIARLVAERHAMEDPVEIEEWVGEITSAQPLASFPNIWIYNVQRKFPSQEGITGIPEYKVWMDPNGDSFNTFAWNRAELHNDGADLEGYGVTVGTDPDTLDTITMNPIMVGVHVLVRGETAEDTSHSSGTQKIYFFNAPNPVTVACGNP